MSPLIELRGIGKNFGGLKALNDISFALNKGEIVGVIGPNGAGKTTLFNVISGVFLPTTGHIIFDGKNITGLKPHQVAHLGIIRTFQLSVLFMEFTVLENVLIGLHKKSTLKPVPMLFSHSFFSDSEIAAAVEILKAVGLIDLKDRLASSLPHGYQRLLGVGIALAAEPKLLLLDEPVTGMNIEEQHSMVSVIQRLNSGGLTVLWSSTILGR